MFGDPRIPPRFWKKVSHYGVLYEMGPFATSAEAEECAKTLRNTLFTHNDHDRQAAS